MSYIHITALHANNHKFTGYGYLKLSRHQGKLQAVCVSTAVGLRTPEQNYIRFTRIKKITCQYVQLLHVYKYFLYFNATTAHFTVLTHATLCEALVRDTIAKSCIHHIIYTQLH